MERTSANVSEECLKDLSAGTPKLARSWVMFDDRRDNLPSSRGRSIK
ncbi:hypothetical protein AC4HA11_1925 [Escherichia phage vB_EcoA_4HA11]|nr:hypothetical protein AC4HA11_1925 [Escherichia phage vB_EcoA_4HA11]